MKEPANEQNGPLLVTVVTVPSLRSQNSIVRAPGVSPDAGCHNDPDRMDDLFLSRAALLLTESLDDSTFREYAVRLPLPYLADWCALHLVAVSPGGRVAPLVVCAHLDPDQETRVRMFWQRAIQKTPQAIPSLAYVLRLNEESLRPKSLDAHLDQVNSDSHSSPAAHLLARVGLATAIHVPLVAGERAHGVMTFASVTPGRYEPPQIAIVMAYASWVAGILARTQSNRQAGESERVYAAAGAREGVRIA